MPQPALGQPQEAPLVGTVQQHLRHRQADQLAIGDPGPASPAATSARQEIIDEDVKHGQQGVEVGVHRDPPMVDVASATPTSAPSYRSLAERQEIGINRLGENAAEKSAAQLGLGEWDDG